MTLAATAACASAGPNRSASQRYEWNGMVLGDVRSGTAVACFGAILASYPPAGCTGWPVVGLDWDTAPNVERYEASGRPTTRSAVLTITVTFDGTQLALTSPPSAGGAFNDQLLCTEFPSTRHEITAFSGYVTLATAGERDGPLIALGDDHTIGVLPDQNGDVTIRALVNDKRAQQWVRANFRDIPVRLCGELRPL
ncbi:MAG: hypothetical protein AB7L13_03865 [Acidimicrobiia bacterium]